MKPFLHSRVSVRKFGGRVEDYDAIHDFMDSPKQAHPDIRFRAIFHHAFGAYVAERIFGRTIINTDGKEVSVRDIVEQHIIDDLGFIPTLSYWLDSMTLPKGAEGKRTTTVHIPFAASSQQQMVD